MLSTPPAITSSISPAAIARAAMATASMLEPQSRLTVAPGTPAAARRAAAPSGRRCDCLPRPGSRTRRPRRPAAASRRPALRSRRARDGDGGEVIRSDAERARRRSGRTGCGRRRRDRPDGRRSWAGYRTLSGKRPRTMHPMVDRTLRAAGTLMLSAIHRGAAGCRPQRHQPGSPEARGRSLPKTSRPRRRSRATASSATPPIESPARAAPAPSGKKS